MCQSASGSRADDGRAEPGSESAMAEDQAQPAGPDLALGIAAADLPDGGKLIGHVGGEAVLLVRRGAEVFAIGAICTHYSGPLADGLVVDGAVRCPWHHACFDLRSGEALRAPALAPVKKWNVVERGQRIFVTGVAAGASLAVERKGAATPTGVKSIAIVGAGAAGNAAAEMLRRRGFAGRVALFGPED